MWPAAFRPEVEPGISFLATDCRNVSVMRPAAFGPYVKPGVFFQRSIAGTCVTYLRIDWLTLLKTKQSVSHPLCQMQTCGQFSSSIIGASMCHVRSLYTSRQVYVIDTDYFSLYLPMDTDFFCLYSFSSIRDFLWTCRPSFPCIFFLPYLICFGRVRPTDSFVPSNVVRNFLIF